MNQEYAEFAEKCYEILEKRSRVYGKSYEKMPPQALAAFIIGKAHRIMAMLEIKGGIGEEKVDDDIKDIVNYCFLLYRRRREAEGE